MLSFVNLVGRLVRKPVQVIEDKRNVHLRMRHPGVSGNRILYTNTTHTTKTNSKISLNGANMHSISQVHSHHFNHKHAYDRHIQLICLVRASFHLEA